MSGKTPGRFLWETLIARRAERGEAAHSGTWDELRPEDREDCEAAALATFPHCRAQLAEALGQANYWERQTVDAMKANALAKRRIAELERTCDQHVDDFLFERKQVVALRQVLTEMFTCLDAGDPAMTAEQLAEWRERAGIEAQS
jgi:hypothetical protein